MQCAPFGNGSPDSHDFPVKFPVSRETPPRERLARDCQHHQNNLLRVSAGQTRGGSHSHHDCCSSERIPGQRAAEAVRHECVGDRCSCRRVIDWNSVANPRLVLETVLGMPCEKLFDPQFGSPLFRGYRFDVKQKTMVRDHSIPDAATLVHRYLTEEPDESVQRTGALRLPTTAAMPGQGLRPRPFPLPSWETKGNFFLNGADYRHSGSRGPYRTVPRI
jgi:hypothetical protein